MPRSRQIPVLETVEALRQIEKSLTKSAVRVRITMLRLLKEDPSLTLKEVAEKLGVTHHSAKRWWSWYTEGGIARLQQLTVDKQSMSDERLLLALRDHIDSKTFRSLDQVTAWLGVSTQQTAPPQKNSKPTPKKDNPFNEQVISFLNSIPITGDIPIWNELIRTALTNSFDDIDRTSIIVNVNCHIINPEKYNPKIGTIQHTSEEKIPIEISVFEESHEERVLNNIRRQGFDVDSYFPPTFYTYYYHNAYIGMILLWRKRSKGPISRQTLETIESLKPFFTFLFTDAVVRLNYMAPVTTAYINIIEDIVRNYDLSTQEHRVLSLHSTGASPDIIAESMNISVHTVRSHLKQIYRKTGVHSTNELFAQHFIAPLRPRGKKKP